MLVFCDSFDHYTDKSQKGWVSSGVLGITAGAGRFGNGLRGGFWDHNAVNQLLGGARTTLIVGVAVRWSGTPTVSPSLITLQLAGAEQISLRLNSTQQLVISRAGTTLATGTTVLLNNVWHYLEFKVFIADSGGTAAVRLNGVPEVSVSSADTKGQTGTGADQVRLGGTTSQSITNDWDDFYVCDDTGTVNNDFLGDVRVEAIFPNGNGNSSQLVGNDGNSTDNYLLVDEAAPNSDTDYVETATVGNKDTYAFANLTPTTGTVYAVAVYPFARKTDTGPRQIVSVARLSGTETDGPTKTLAMSYQYHGDIRESKPGGGAWTIADVNSAEFGIKVSG
jgi:hypothetical protein